VDDARAVGGSFLKRTKKARARERTWRSLLRARCWQLDGVAEGANALGPLREGLGFGGMQVIGDVVGVVAGGVVRGERVNDDLKAERAVEEGVV